MPGIDTLAAPVFDHTGSLALVIAVMGSSGSFDSRTEGALPRCWGRRRAAVVALRRAGHSLNSGHQLSSLILADLIRLSHFSYCARI